MILSHPLSIFINRFTITVSISTLSIICSSLLLRILEHNLNPLLHLLFVVGSLTKVFQFPIADNTYHDSYGLFCFGGIRSDPCF